MKPGDNVMIKTPWGEWTPGTITELTLTGAWVRVKLTTGSSALLWRLRKSIRMAGE